MAIYRVGPPEGPTTTELGGVLVTIDDLDALISLVLELESRYGGTNTLCRVEFDGGYFTDAEDLRRLSDQEIQSLRIKTDSVQIVLNKKRAAAIASEECGQEVYRLWARTRRNKRYPKSHKMLFEDTFLISITTIFVLALLGFPPSFATWLGTDNIPITTSVPASIVAVLAVAAISRFTKEVPRSWAAIIPSSMDEYRNSRANSAIPRWTLVVTAVSVLVAIAAVVATFMTAS